MSGLHLFTEDSFGVTAVSNCFIDEYMKDANDAQLKIYLYLLRRVNAGLSVSIGEIADYFNHMEKDVIRALVYWEKRGILSLQRGEDGTITGICFLTPVSSHAKKETSSPDREHRDFKNPAVSSSPLPASADKDPDGFASRFTYTQADSHEQKFTKPSYSLDELKTFKEQENTAQILFIAEQYLGRTLSPSDVTSLLFFSDKLHFSDDLIDYLLQYCVERGKKDFRYIEKVALSWAEAGVFTVQDAQNHSSRYDKTVYSVMNSLGKSHAPTPREVDYIRRWSQEFGFSLDIILEACQRTVMATDRHRFEYADKILRAWKDAGVHHLSDVSRMDASFKKDRPAANRQPRTSAEKYNRFMQNSYDFDALEKELLKN